MPGARGHLKSPAIPSSAASSSATQDQILDQPRTTQQGEPAVTTSHAEAAKESGSSRADAIVICDSSSSDDAADGVDWHDESSITRYLTSGHSRDDLAALAKKELSKEMDSWRDSYPAIKNDLLQFLGDSKAKVRLVRMIIALERRGSDAEDDDEDEDGTDDEGGEEGEGYEWTVLPPPQLNNTTLGSDEALGSVAEPVEPEITTSSLEQVVIVGLTFDEAINIVNKQKKIKEGDDVAVVKAQPQKWITAIVRAFRKAPSDTPTLIDFEDMSPKFLPGFIKWQTDHVEKTEKRLKGGARLPEAIATVVFNLVIQRHEKGTLEKSYGARIKPDTTLSCSTRLKLITAAIEKLAIIRWDVVAGIRLDDLVNNPVAAAKFKETNKKVNDLKNEKDKQLHKSDPANSARKGSLVAMYAAQKLLEGCTFLADVDGDTDMENAPALKTAGA